MKLSKSIYIIISGLLSFNFLSNGLLSFLTNDLLFVLMFVWSIFGWFYYNDEKSPIYNNSIYWVFAILILMFLSALTPMFRYGQSLQSTLLAMRTNVLITFLITLLKVYPNEEELFKAFRILGLLALAMAVLVIFFPHWFVDMETVKRLLNRQIQGSTDVAVIWPGSGCAVIYFYILLQKMRQDPTRSNVICCCVFMLYIFLMQNRSTLVCALPFFVYTFLKTNIRYKGWIIALSCIIGGVYAVDVFSGLIEETRSQLSDRKYNRWQAIYFFIMEQNNNLYTILFGNGMPCKGSSYLSYITQAQTKRLAFISDIGLIGSYFYYGIAMMAIVYRFIIKGIKGAYSPRFLKYYCWWLLLIPTIHGFGLGNNLSMIRYAIVFYMILYYEQQYRCIDNNSELQHA